MSRDLVQKPSMADPVAENPFSAATPGRSKQEAPLPDSQERQWQQQHGLSPLLSSPFIAPLQSVFDLYSDRTTSVDHQTRGNGPSGPVQPKLDQDPAAPPPNPQSKWRVANAEELARYDPKKAAKAGQEGYIHYITNKDGEIQPYIYTRNDIEDNLKNPKEPNAPFDTRAFSDPAFQETSKSKAGKVRESRGRVEILMPDGTVQELKGNQYGMVQFPESGPGFSRYTNNNNDQYSLNGHYKNQDKDKAGTGQWGDNWAKPDTAAGFYNLIQDFRGTKDGQGVNIHYGDMSAYDPSCNLGHKTHFTGQSIDIAYMGKNGQELRGNSAYSQADVGRSNQFLHLARERGFTNNYTYGNRFDNEKNTPEHNNHFHIGHPKDYRAPEKEDPSAPILDIKEYLRIVKTTEDYYKNQAKMEGKEYDSSNMVSGMRALYGYEGTVPSSVYGGDQWENMIPDAPNIAPPTAEQVPSIDRLFTMKKNEKGELVRGQARLVRLPNGELVDPGHLYTGIDSALNPDANWKLDAYGINNRDATTWSGDVGSAVVERDKGLSVQQAMDRHAGIPDLNSDLDGYNLGSSYSGKRSLHDQLAKYYLPPDKREVGASDYLSRYSTFAQNRGLRHKNGTLDDDAKDTIRSEVDDFAEAYGRRSSNIFSKGFGVIWSKYNEDSDGSKAMTDRFIDYLEDGLSNEPQTQP